MGERREWREEWVRVLVRKCEWGVERKGEEREESAAASIGVGSDRRGEEEGKEMKEESDRFG